jgi:hypothetical protein
MIYIEGIHFLQVELSICKFKNQFIDAVTAEVLSD